MIAQFNITAGQLFTVQNKADWRYGKTFRVIGFKADKWGLVYAVCEMIGEPSPKSSYIFYSEEFA